jgi:Rod binding domain-containing protein
MEIEQMLGGSPMMANSGVSPVSPGIPQFDASIDYDEEEKKKVAQDFESIFIHQLLETMKATIPDEESEDVAAGQVKSMYWSFMADAISDQGGLGLWKDIYKSMPKDTDASNAQQGSEGLDGKV